MSTSITTVTTVKPPAASTFAHAALYEEALRVLRITARHWGMCTTGPGRAA